MSNEDHICPTMSHVDLLKNWLVLLREKKQEN